MPSLSSTGMLHSVCKISHNSYCDDKNLFLSGSSYSGHVFDRWTLECCSWESESQPSVEGMNSVPIQRNNNDAEAV